MSISRIETIAAELVAEYSAIAKAAGYRNDLSPSVIYGIRPIEKITREVEVGIQIADELLYITNDMCTEFDSDADVYVEATIKTGIDNAGSDAYVESVLHDIKRCTAKLIKKYVVANSQWNINVEKKINVYHDVFSTSGRNAHRVGVKFMIHVRNQGEDLT